MNKDEQRKFIELIIEEIQIYEKRQSNSQWIKSIVFKLPLIEESFNAGLDNNLQVDISLFLYFYIFTDLCFNPNYFLFHKY